MLRWMGVLAPAPMCRPRRILVIWPRKRSATRWKPKSWPMCPAGRWPRASITTARSTPRPWSTTTICKFRGFAADREILPQASQPQALQTPRRLQRVIPQRPLDALAVQCWSPVARVSRCARDLMTCLSPSPAPTLVALVDGKRPATTGMCQVAAFCVTSEAGCCM